MKELYESQLQTLSPVAVRVGTGQTEVNAPEHEQVETVTCDSCGATFLLAHNRIYGSRMTTEQSTNALKSRLAEDHRQGLEHQNGYILPD